MDAVAELERLLASAGGQAYFGEAVSVATHLLQAGTLAASSGAPDPVVAAALLHDVGHILGPGLVSADAHHEERGAAYLAHWFGPDVCEPVRFHVAAKRYLCALEPDYYARLSDASRYSLLLQGGVMSPDDVRAFDRCAACERGSGRAALGRRRERSARVHTTVRVVPAAAAAADRRA